MSDLRKGATMPTLPEMLAMSDEDLATVDPLAMNLAVARGIPSLASLDVARYVRRADEWAVAVRRCMRKMEPEFHSAPGNWKNDIRFFRLGIICWYADQVLHIRYPDNLAKLGEDTYVDPKNIFLHGLMDTRHGTCSSMPVLHVALGWRLGWPVALACAGPHLFCRYDGGTIKHNIEATSAGCGGFRSHPDDYYRKLYRVPEIAVRCGSDLRAVSPRDMLGIFVVMRGWHFEATGLLREAESDFLLGRYLFPQNRNFYIAQINASVHRSTSLFDPCELGHPVGLSRWVAGYVRNLTQGSLCTANTEEIRHGTHACFSANQAFAGRW